jgi:RNA polymerase sigma-70 factor (ECF subfamily)
MTSETVDREQILLERIRGGDQEALAEFFTRCRDRLRRMVSLRLDPRLRGRIDASDILQEAYLDISRRAAEYAARPEMPFFLWLRMMAGQKLLEVHRRHIKTQMRDIGHEVSLHQGAFLEADSESLAAQLLGRLSSASQAAVRAELKLRLQEVLSRMGEHDREILALRHFEELSNGEVAAVLNLSKAAASNRYIRALKRLKNELVKIPGFLQ